jgi:hypothetical protein
VSIREDATRPSLDSSQIQGDSASFSVVLCTRTTIPTQRFCRKNLCIYDFYLHEDNANDFFIVCVYKASVNICRKFSDIRLIGEEACINTASTVYDAEQTT